jgi:hypothetical protein
MNVPVTKPCTLIKVAQLNMSEVRNQVENWAVGANLASDKQRDDVLRLASFLTDSQCSALQVHVCTSSSHFLLAGYLTVLSVSRKTVVINGRWIRKVLERSCWAIIVPLSQNFPEITGDDNKKVKQDSRSPGRDSNQGPPEYSSIEFPVDWLAS